ncbi:ABC transporter ATP-binding protein [Actinosynnema mirum]|uniref:ABC transporter related n=1 Tax=Actinosynnema mirum (strain ATCC 29888 / DSM 43827 / JCM 3225 / NBRC 14064 / NCIMB 13271 / NRRL B-12336 / IMRU 3971 / 101) TaxID=446462 RepID=C6WEI5_ACTMD|nr:ABC transporter ATP-binding protein [Actinosynnema mirum]ACU37785.1 ABC transporter related [Actinosynnema mirum DSM 43827]AXX31269.1 ABC transporter (iron.B12.siderophore.hemin), ATP-binding component [Actinosynnema pretiosum subsp. pretiosum]
MSANGSGPPRVVVDGVSVELGGGPVVAGASLTVGAGEVVGVVGPNGSGKSTLLRAVYRALRPAAGAVRVDGADVWGLTARESARRTAVVVQESGSDFALKVADVVAMGRNPHKGPLERDTADDRRICAEAVARTGVAHLAGRDFDTLSGGEKQRVLLARALAQQPKLLVLDEPTNHLDIRYQLELLDLVRALGTTTLTVMHDLALAVAYCDRVHVLHRGRIVADGPPAQVLTAELVAEVFGVRACRWVDPDTGQAHLGFSRLPGTDRTAERNPA